MLLNFVDLTILTIFYRIAHTRGRYAFLQNSIFCFVFCDVNPPVLLLYVLRMLQEVVLGRRIQQGTLGMRVIRWHAGEEDGIVEGRDR